MRVLTLTHSALPQYSMPSDEAVKNSFRRRLYLVMHLLLAIPWIPQTAVASPSPSAPEVPPPVSGRRLSEPETISNADVLSRVKLIRAQLDVIRRFVGRPTAPKTFLNVTGAHSREVYIQIYGLLHRVQRLGFEYVGTPITTLEPLRLKSTPATNFVLLNQILTTVLTVREYLGIKVPIPEKLEALETSESDVFNSVVALAQELEVLFDQKERDSEVYSLIAYGQNLASLLSSHTSKKFRPLEPDFVPFKTHKDVYKILYDSYQEIEKIAEAYNLSVLSFSLNEAMIAQASVAHVWELSVLMASELLFLNRAILNIEPNQRPFYHGRRFPSHSVQQATLLKQVLKSIRRTPKSLRRKAP